MLAFVVPAFATTYYVDPAGNDNNPGTVTEPFATIQKAADVVNPGDTVIVRDGTYTDTNADGHIVEAFRSGTATEPILFMAEHEWGAVLDGQNYLTSFGWELHGVSYVNIQGFTITEVWEVGVWPSYAANHCKIWQCHIHHIGNIQSSGSTGLDGCYDDPDTSYITYDSNVIHDIGRTSGPDNLDHGIYTCGDYNVIENNTIYNCPVGWCIQVAGYKTVANLVITNNTMAYGVSRAHIILWKAISDLTIQNNVFYMPPASRNAIEIYSARFSGTNLIRNNIEYGGLGLNDPNKKLTLSANIIGQDPLLVDPSAYDFHLQATSPAIDAGIAALAPSWDQDQFTRPYPVGGAFDMGAFEYH